MDENKTIEATPDQLLQMLDLQIALQRQRRKPRAKGRLAALIAGMFLIIALTLLALLFLRDMIPASDRSQQLESASAVRIEAE